MTIALVQKVQRTPLNSAQSPGTSVSATFGATPTQGNLLVLVLAAAAVASTITLPTGWIPLLSLDAVGNPAGSGVTRWVVAAYKTARASEPTTVTVDATGATTFDLLLEEWTGFTSPTLDVSVTNYKADNDSGVGNASFDCGTTPTTRADDELALAVCVTANRSSEVFSDGFTVENTDTSRAMVGSLVLATTQSVQTTASWATTGNNAAGGIFTFRSRQPTVPPAARRYSGDQLLDLPANLGQRIEGMRYDILTADLQYAFTCTQVNRNENVPTMRFDANADVNRTLSQMWFGPADTAQIDPLSHLLMPRWVLDDGSMYNMGVLHFATLPLERHSWGDAYVPSLYDSSVILNQPRRGSFSIRVGELLTTAARRIIDEVGLTARAAIDNSTEYAHSPQVFAPGTTRRQILAWICQALGYYPPYFDNDGFLRLRAVPNPISQAAPDVVYTEDENSRIIRDSVKISSNIVDAPNVYQVIGSPDAGGEVSGEFRVPASAPHSVEHRGWEIVKQVTNQNVYSKSAADSAAQAEYVNDFSTYLAITAQTSADPRADGMQIANYLGVNYREQSWDVVLTHGGIMNHEWQTLWLP